MRTAGRTPSASDNRGLSAVILVVFDAPLFGRMPRFKQIWEAVQVEQFIANAVGKSVMTDGDAWAGRRSGLHDCAVRTSPGKLVRFRSDAPATPLGARGARSR